MTDAELSEICARNKFTLVCSGEDVPALLAHIEEQRAEIEHLRLSLEWLVEKTASACAIAVGCPFMGPCPIEDTRCLDIEAEDWLKASHNAVKEAAVNDTEKQHGLSIDEQAQVLWATCRWNKNPEACPANLMEELENVCPLGCECEEVLPKMWVEFLSKREAPCKKN